jgi:hypothetical protein
MLLISWLQHKFGILKIWYLFLSSVFWILCNHLLLRRYDMNGKSQMQGGKNWILPKNVYVNRFFRDSHWLEIWARICNRLWSPGIDSEKSISSAYVARRAGTKNRVVVLARQTGNRSWAPQMVYKYGPWKNHLCPSVGQNGESVAIDSWNKHIYLKRIWTMCKRKNCPFSTLKI